MTHDIQVVILAGGRGTRLGAAGDNVPKILQPVAGGTTFADLLIRTLVNQDFRRISLCLGFLADRVIAHAARNWPHLDMTFHVDEIPQGTAGALLAARYQLDDTFLLVLGDTYIDMDFRSVAGDLDAHSLGTMVITRSVTSVPANVEFVSPIITRYEKGLGTASGWVDAGLMCLRREALDLISSDQPPIDLGVLFRHMISREALRGFPTSQSFYDIGTPARLERFSRITDARQL